MSRLTVALVALVCLLAGGLTATLLRPAAPDMADIRAEIDAALADQAVKTPPVQQVASLDPQQLNPLIESYLMSDPAVLQRVSDKLQEQAAAAKRADERTKIAAEYDNIFNDPDGVVLGNPNGDVTLVEMFDYNCSYCRGALPDLATLLAEDPKLKVVLREFPILTAGSEEAAKVAVVVAKSKVNYWDFHQALFSSRGEVTKETALNEAQKLGLNRFFLEAQMGSEQVNQVLLKSFDLANALGVSGTPTYIIGDEMIPGAIGLDELRARIANMRTCGKTDCSPTAG